MSTDPPAEYVDGGYRSSLLNTGAERLPIVEMKGGLRRGRRKVGGDAVPPAGPITGRANVPGRAAVPPAAPAVPPAAPAVPPAAPVVPPAAPVTPPAAPAVPPGPAASAVPGTQKDFFAPDITEEEFSEAGGNKFMTYVEFIAALDNCGTLVGELTAPCATVREIMYSILFYRLNNIKSITSEGLIEGLPTSDQIQSYSTNELKVLIQKLQELLGKHSDLIGNYHTKVNDLLETLIRLVKKISEMPGADRAIQSPAADTLAELARLLGVLEIQRGAPPEAPSVPPTSPGGNNWPEAPSVPPTSPGGNNWPEAPSVPPTSPGGNNWPEAPSVPPTSPGGNNWPEAPSVPPTSPGGNNWPEAPSVPPTPPTSLAQNNISKYANIFGKPDNTEQPVITPVPATAPAPPVAALNALESLANGETGIPPIKTPEVVNILSELDKLLELLNKTTISEPLGAESVINLITGVRNKVNEAKKSNLSAANRAIANEIDTQLGDLLGLLLRAQPSDDKIASVLENQYTTLQKLRRNMEERPSEVDVGETLEQLKNMRKLLGAIELSADQKVPNAIKRANIEQINGLRESLLALQQEAQKAAANATISAKPHIVSESIYSQLPPVYQLPPLTVNSAVKDATDAAAKATEAMTVFNAAISAGDTKGAQAAAETIRKETDAAKTAAAKATEAMTVFNAAIAAGDTKGAQAAAEEAVRTAAPAPTDDEKQAAAEEAVRTAAPAPTDDEKQAAMNAVYYEALVNYSQKATELPADTLTTEWVRIDTGGEGECFFRSLYYGSKYHKDPTVFNDLLDAFGINLSDVKDMQSFNRIIRAKLISILTGLTPKDALYILIENQLNIYRTQQMNNTISNNDKREEYRTFKEEFVGYSKFPAQEDFKHISTQDWIKLLVDYIEPEYSWSNSVYFGIIAFFLYKKALFIQQLQQSFLKNREVRENELPVPIQSSKEEKTDLFSRNNPLMVRVINIYYTFPAHYETIIQSDRIPAELVGKNTTKFTILGWMQAYVNEYIPDKKKVQGDKLIKDMTEWTGSIEDAINTFRENLQNIETTPAPAGAGGPPAPAAAQSPAPSQPLTQEGEAEEAAQKLEITVAEDTQQKTNRILRSSWTTNTTRKNNALKEFKTYKLSSQMRNSIKNSIDTKRNITKKLVFPQIIIDTIHKNIEELFTKRDILLNILKNISIIRTIRLTKEDKDKFIKELQKYNQESDFKNIDDLKLFINNCLLIALRVYKNINDNNTKNALFSVYKMIIPIRNSIYNIMGIPIPK